MLLPRLRTIQLMIFVSLLALPALACGRGSVLSNTPETPAAAPAGLATPTATVDFSAPASSPELVISPTITAAMETPAGKTSSAGNQPADTAVTTSGLQTPLETPTALKTTEAAATVTPVKTSTAAVEEDDPAGDALDQALKELDSYFENTDTLNDLK